MEANPNLKVIVPRANINFAAERLQVSPDRWTPIRADGKAIGVGPFTFYAIPSAHESLEQDDHGDQLFIDLIVQAGNRTIYHGGDCVPYDDLVKRLKHWQIDLALPPIKGCDPACGVAGNFTAEEAARLGKAASLGKVISCHYEMFEFNVISPERFIQLAGQIGQEYHVLKCGERLDL